MWSSLRRVLVGVLWWTSGAASDGMAKRSKEEATFSLNKTSLNKRRFYSINEYHNKLATSA
jgi:hypothetical protein